MGYNFLSCIHLNVLYDITSSRITIGLAYSDDYGATWDIVDTAVIWYLAGRTLKCKDTTRVIYNRATKHMHSMIAKGDTIAIAYVRFNSLKTCNVRVAYNYSLSPYGWAGRWADSTLSNDQIQPVIVQSAGVWFVFWKERSDTVDYITKAWRVEWAKSVDRGASWIYGGRVSSDTFLMFDDTTGGDYMGFVFNEGALYGVWGNDRRFPTAMVFFTRTTPGIISADEGREEGGSPPFDVSGGSLTLLTFGRVYSASGRLVYEGKGRVSLPRGAYFVKVGGRVFKVLIR